MNKLLVVKINHNGKDYQASYNGEEYILLPDGTILSSLLINHTGYVDFYALDISFDMQNPQLSANIIGAVLATEVVDD